MEGLVQVARRGSRTQCNMFLLRINIGTTHQNRLFRAAENRQHGCFGSVGKHYQETELAVPDGKDRPLDVIGIER